MAGVESVTGNERGRLPARVKRDCSLQVGFGSLHSSGIVVVEFGERVSGLHLLTRSPEPQNSDCWIYGVVLAEPASPQSSCSKSDPPAVDHVQLAARRGEPEASCRCPWQACEVFGHLGITTLGGNHPCEHIARRRIVQRLSDLKSPFLCISCQLDGRQCLTTQADDQLT